MATLVKVIGILNAVDSPDGKPKYPGDWVEIKNKNHLRKLLADGTVEVPQWLAEKAAGELVGAGCTLLIRGRPDCVSLDVLRSFKDVVEVRWQQKPQVLNDRVMIWHPSAPITYQQFLLGFGRLEPAKKGFAAWEMAAMWMGNKMLAANYGLVAEQKKTKAVTRELRVPIYDTRLVWVRRTETTEAVIQQWAKEIDAGANEAHAFVRAIYTHKPMLNTLPQNWMVI